MTDIDKLRAALEEIDQPHRDLISRRIARDALALPQSDEVESGWPRFEQWGQNIIVSFQEPYEPLSIPRATIDIASEISTQRVEAHLLFAILQELRALPTPPASQPAEEEPK